MVSFGISILKILQWFIFLEYRVLNRLQLFNPKDVILIYVVWRVWLGDVLISSRIVIIFFFFGVFQ